MSPHPSKIFHRLSRGIRLIFAMIFLFSGPVFLSGCVKSSTHEAVMKDLARTQGQLGRFQEKNKILKTTLAREEMEIKRLEAEVLTLKTGERIHIQDTERLAQKNIELSSEVAQLNRLTSALNETSHSQDKRLEKLRTNLLQESEAKKQEEREKLELLQEVETRRKEMARLKTTHDRLVGELHEEIRQGEIQVTQARDRLSVNLVDQILFDSGSATIKPRGLEVLGRVGKILSKLTDKEIQIQGHTDALPISGKLRGKYPSNWELSAARAITVVRYLSETSGIDSRFLSAVGQGDSKPVASNETPRGRAQNRRIEIILKPLEMIEPASPVPAEASEPENR